MSPESVAAHLGLANYYWAAGQLDDAEASFNTALKLEPNSAEVHRSTADLAVLAHPAPVCEQLARIIPARPPSAKAAPPSQSRSRPPGTRSHP